MRSWTRIRNTEQGASSEPHARHNGSGVVGNHRRRVLAFHLDLVALVWCIASSLIWSVSAFDGSRLGLLALAEMVGDGGSSSASPAHASSEKRANHGQKQHPLDKGTSGRPGKPRVRTDSR